MCAETGICPKTTVLSSFLLYLNEEINKVYLVTQDSETRPIKQSKYM